MTVQTNMNPFLKGDYLEDLENQETYLKSRSSNNMPNSYNNNQ